MTAMQISIPAPARGATGSRLVLFPPAYRFQFPPLREGRLASRCRRYTLLSISIPAPVRGATRRVVVGPQACRISIPAPARGATGAATGIAREFKISIPAPARGATRLDARHVVLGNYFNSRPCARGDFHRASPRAMRAYFNSRPCARGDSTPLYCRVGLIYFNSRPCARGDPREPG